MEEEGGEEEEDGEDWEGCDIRCWANNKNGIFKEETLLTASVCSDKTDHRVHNNGSIVFLSNCKFMKTKVLYIMKNCN